MFWYARKDLDTMAMNQAIFDVGQHFKVPWEVAWTVTQDAFRYPLTGKGPTTRAGMQGTITKLELDALGDLKNDPDLADILFGSGMITISQATKDYLIKRYRELHR